MEENETTPTPSTEQPQRAEEALQAQPAPLTQPAAGDAHRLPNELQVQLLSESLEFNRTLIWYLPLPPDRTDWSMAVLGAQLHGPVEEVLGYSAQAFAQEPRLWPNRIHPEDRPEVERRTAELFQQGTPVTRLYRWQHRDGHWVWLREQVYLKRDAAGRPVAVRGVATDVTDVVQVQEEEQLAARVYRVLAQRKPGAALESVLALLGDLWPVDSAALLLWEPGAGGFAGQIQWVRPDAVEAARAMFQALYDQAEPGSLPLGVGSYADAVMQTGQPLYVPDLAQSPYWGDDVRARHGWRTTLVWPLVLRDDFKALLILQSRLVDAFTEQNRAVLARLQPALAAAVEAWHFEEALQKAHDELEMRVQERTAELAKANEELQAEIIERKRSEEEKARNQRLLLALSQAAQAVQQARTPDQVYRAVTDHVSRLGYNAAIFTLTDDRAYLTPSYLSYEPAAIRAAEKLTGLSAQGYRFPLVPGGLYQQVVIEGKTVFSEPIVEFVAEALPTSLRPLAGRLTALLGIEQSIIAPLIVGGEPYGLLAVAGTDLTEAAVSAMTAFANQAAIAIESARLYQQVQRYAAELEQRVAERTRELETLYDVTAMASQALELEAMLERALEQVLVALESDAGTIHLLDEAEGSTDEQTLRLVAQRGVPTDLLTEPMSVPPHGVGAAWWVVEHDEPLLVPDVTSDPRTASTWTEPWSYVGVPLRAGGRTLGVLSLGRRMGQRQFSVEEISLLTSIGDQLGIAVENARLRQKAEQAAVLEERERLARELHDSITQLLYSMNLFAKSGRNAYHYGDIGELGHCLTELGEIGQQALREMRLLVFELRPPALAQYGLSGALQRRLDTVERRVGVEAQLLADEAIALPEQIEEGLYHIAIQALNNALKHARATSVTVSIDADKEGVQFEVADNGSGFDPHAVEGKGGLGLVNMRERAERLGGVLTIASTPGRGTRVSVTVPINS